jgi:hypothetical protein
MGQPSNREPDAAQETFDATLRKLLATPPRPHGGKKRSRKPKSAAKAKKR